VNISLKRRLKLRKESALTVGKSLALILYLARRWWCESEGYVD
jgi:hypothetical protein